MERVHKAWDISIFIEPDGQTSWAIGHYDGTTWHDLGNYEHYSSSSEAFQEQMSVLDASIFTCLAIADPDGMPFTIE